MSDDVAFPEDLPALPILLDTLPSSLIIYRPNGTLVGMNRAAERLWSVVRSGVIGKFNMLEDPQSVEQGSHALFARVLAGETVVTPAVNYDTTRVHPDIAVAGTIRIWVESTIFPLRDIDGAVSHIGLMHRDVTERLEQSQAIAAAQHEIDIQRAAILSLSSQLCRSGRGSWRCHWLAQLIHGGRRRSPRIC